MSKNSYIARSRGVSRLYAHLVLTTKYRYDVINPEMLQRLREVMKSLCEKWQCELIECNGEPNHLHVLFRYAPLIPTLNGVPLQSGASRLNAKAG